MGVENWAEALSAAGAEIVSATRDRVTLRSVHGEQSFTVHRRSRPPYPSEFTVPAAGNALLVAPRLTPAVEARLAELGWSWATGAGQVRVRFGEHVITPEPAPEPAIPPAVIRGTAAFLALRRLLASPMRQGDLAAAMGVSQPRASRVLSDLAGQGLVARDDGRWQVRDWDQAAAAWLARYPGPGGTVTWWSALDTDPWALTLTALSVLPAEAVVSGDTGADLIAPWRRPARAVIYTPGWHDLERAGLVQAGAPGSTVITVCVPEDRGVWPAEPFTRTFRDRRVNAADPFQVLWDVRRTGDADSAEAAGHLLGRLRERHEENRRANA